MKTYRHKLVVLYQTYPQLSLEDPNYSMTCGNKVPNQHSLFLKLIVSKHIEKLFQMMNNT